MASGAGERWIRRDAWGTAQHAAVVLALLLLVACQAPWDNPAASPTPTPRAVITPKQALQVYRKLYAQRSAAIVARNLGALQTVATSSALLSTQGFVNLLLARGTTATVPALTSPSVLVPRQTEYPAWFIALGKESTSSGPAWGLDEVSRAGTSEPWKFSAITGFEGQPPPVAMASAGYAAVGSLRRDPSTDLAAFFQAFAHGQATTGVANSGAASDIATNARETIVNYGNKGWAIDDQYSEGGSIPDSVRLRDGSSLGLAWVAETLYVATASGACFQQPQSNGARWDGRVPDGNYKTLEITYVIVAPVMEPKSGDDQVLGSNVSTTNVASQNC
ncbi:MAG: hypothetical protein WAM30_17300 [Candidatus Dormiibacterota bacterium]